MNGKRELVERMSVLEMEGVPELICGCMCVCVLMCACMVRVKCVRRGCACVCVPMHVCWGDAFVWISTCVRA